MFATERRRRHKPQRWRNDVVGLGALDAPALILGTPFHSLRCSPPCGNVPIGAIFGALGDDKPPRLHIHDWGLPSAGPFAIKLLAWLELAGIPYEQVIEDNPRKGPKGKNPWIELDGEPMGDTELIIDLLSKRYGVDLDAALSSEQKAAGLAWRRTFEEHFHQVLEWELFVHPAGAAYMRERMLSNMPPIIGPFVFSMLSSHLRKQLYARGLARHTPNIIAAKGRADIDALAAFLGDKPFLLGQQPNTADTAVFGLLARVVYWPCRRRSLHTLNP